MAARWLMTLALLCLFPAIDSVAQAPIADAASPPIRISGEIGTRVEYIANEHFARTNATREDDHRFRARLRFRLGGNVPLSDRLEAGVRLATGEPTYPTSAWTTPSDFRRIGIQIDRAYLAYRYSETVTLRAGAYANPLFTPTELVWDGDVQPVGLSQVLRPFGGRVTVAAGQYAIRETRSARDANLQSAYLLTQGVSYSLPAPGFSTTVGLTQYYFYNADVIARAAKLGELDGDFLTNRYDPGGRLAADPRDTSRLLHVDYFSGFNVLNGGIRLDSDRAPISLTADVALNIAASRNPDLGAAYASRENLGYGGMLRFGRPREPGDGGLGIGYFHIEADAVVAAYNSDDLQQTNVRTVPIEAQLFLAPRTRIVWDTYAQRKLSTKLASNGGIVHPENAWKVRSRISVIAAF